MAVGRRADHRPRASLHDLHAAAAVFATRPTARGTDLSGIAARLPDLGAQEGAAALPSRASPRPARRAGTLGPGAERRRAAAPRLLPAPATRARLGVHG